MDERLITHMKVDGANGRKKELRRKLLCYLNYDKDWYKKDDSLFEEEIKLLGKKLSNPDLVFFEKVDQLSFDRYIFLREKGFSKKKILLMYGEKYKKYENMYKSLKTCDYKGTE